MLKLLRRFVHIWPDFLSLPVLTMAFVGSYHLLYAVMGESAGFIDPSKLQRLFFVFVTMAAFNSFVFLGIKFNFCGLYKWYRDVFIDNANDLTPWEKAKLLIALYSVLLACCCWLAMVFAQ